jgi:hypothetical protein
MDNGFVGDQIDHRLLNTGHFQQATLNTPSTGRTGHAAYRNLQSL